MSVKMSIKDNLIQENEELRQDIRNKTKVILELVEKNKNLQHEMKNKEQENLLLHTAISAIKEGGI